ncbi:TBCC domain-containing protein 1-like [Centruroides sculpturatus]|uniref:TBCC domain-containing protein 1-like n=1 Tax=Centruroides sculpturatus TaxID=218467 RepID=UPI000C6D2217|nr:TBCC domain-containing protein 1-like [Centruroides sculpturatus]
MYQCKYFENYFLVHLRKVDERIEWDRQFSDVTEKDVEEIKSKVEVCSLRFVLMLYLQNIHKTSLCSNIVMQEEWPSQFKQSRHKRQDHMEQKQLMFVRTNLEEIIGLLTDEDKFTDEISECVIEALSFLIEGSSDKNRTVATLHDIVRMEENKKETSFKMESRTFDYRKLMKWIKTHLGPNPFNICTDVTRERCSSWPRIGKF